MVHARIVDHDVERAHAIDDALRQCRDSHQILHVEREDLRVVQRAGGFAQGLFGPRHQRDANAARVQLARDRQPDAGRPAGDECNFPLRHVPLLTDVRPART